MAPPILLTLLFRGPRPQNKGLADPPCKAFSSMHQGPRCIVNQQEEQLFFFTFITSGVLLPARRRGGGIEPLHVSMPHELKSRPSTSPTHPGCCVQKVRLGNTLILELEMLHSESHAS